jgi:alpha-beta hydrolase superfamily lysophospholipase
MEHEPALGLGAPTVAWADAAMRQMNQFAEHSYSASIRQPILMVAAGRDEVVSTPAIETFGQNLLAGRHLILAGAKHEILQEQDRYRAQFGPSMLSCPVHRGFSGRSAYSALSCPGFPALPDARACRRRR